MGIGHVAVGLGLKRADSRINVGWLVLAALLPDFLLGWFVLAGWENYQPPAGYASGHYLLFTFPWSHGLLPDLLWAALAALLAFALLRRMAAALAVGIGVASHFLLDGIVHVKGLPLVGTGPPYFGLGLWRLLPLELALELAMAAAGLWLYLSALRKQSLGARRGMVIYTVALALFLVVGQASATKVPPRATLIGSWLAGPLLMAGIALWLDRRPAGWKQSS